MKEGGGNDHRQIAEKLAETLDGFRRTLDPAMDVLRISDTKEEHRLADISSNSERVVEMVEEKGFVKFHGVNKIMRNFWVRIMIIIFFLFIVYLINEWLIQRKNRNTSTTTTNPRTPRQNHTSSQWKNKCFIYFIQSGLVTLSIIFILFYHLQMSTVPCQLLKIFI